MLLLNPESVKFGSSLWTDVTGVVIDRAAERLAAEWSDMGPYAVLVDVPEQRVTVRVTRRLVRDTPSSPVPSDAAELTVCTSPGAGDARRRRIRIQCVVTGVTHDMKDQRSATQTITLLAVSSDGAANPVTVEDATDGSF